MKRHLRYLQYILKHKWFVFVASLKIKAPIWDAIIHDISKLYPSEWAGYANAFYAKDGKRQYCETLEFAQAWNHHQKRNKHHYQYWTIIWDNGKIESLPMPEKYALAMIADWMGAGRAITGKWEVKEWYLKNERNIKLHDKTKYFVKLTIFSLDI